MCPEHDWGHWSAIEKAHEHLCRCATANMSKYEILTQTGIAALAQANQMQQQVTKLLQ